MVKGIKKYLRELSIDILDEHNVFVEFTLVWIAGMLTLLVGFIILQILFGG
jgi:hypothetical protein